MKYKQVYDGDPLFDQGSNSTLLGCCDCGLVHLFTREDDGTTITITRKDRETAKRRRQLMAELEEVCGRCKQPIVSPGVVKITIVKGEVVFEHEYCPRTEPEETPKPRRGRPPKTKVSSDS